MLQPAVMNVKKETVTLVYSEKEEVAEKQAGEQMASPSVWSV